MAETAWTNLAAICKLYIFSRPPPSGRTVHLPPSTKVQCHKGLNYHKKGASSSKNKAIKNTKLLFMQPYADSINHNNTSMRSKSLAGPLGLIQVNIKYFYILILQVDCREPAYKEW